MLNLLDNLRIKRYDLLVEEDDVMNVLRVIDIAKHNCKHDVLMNMELGNCGLTKEPSKWFISFEARNKKWKFIIKELSKKNYNIVLKDDGELYLEKIEH